MELRLTVEEKYGLENLTCVLINICLILFDLFDLFDFNLVRKQSLV